MKELKLVELSTRQKLGMTMTAFLSKKSEQLEYVLELIKNHSLGAVWIQPPRDDLEEVMAKIKAAADYPILIVCDAENGIGDYMIGKHNSLGCTGREDLAYIFGKAIAVEARKMGFNMLCNPILDMVNGNSACGGNVRSLGNDKYKVTALARAEAQGMHDGGVLTVAKHYPGNSEEDYEIDSHMAEGVSGATVEELLDYNLYPYIELAKEDLLDGMMTRHTRFTKIDDKYPASLSKKVINIIRERGFNGFAMTDALCMMGVVAKFGKKGAIGLSIANGNDLSLPFFVDNAFSYNSLCECYDEGMISDERLDEAASRVLAAQSKTLIEPKYTHLTDEDIALFHLINRDSVYAKAEDGMPISISRDGKHYFAVLTESTLAIDDIGKVDVDTFGNAWYHPLEIIDKLKELFPNSTVESITQFPSSGENCRVLDHSLDHDDVIFITFYDSKAYLGTECLTSRILSLMKAMQVTNRISTVVHFGNPYVLEDLPYIPRILIGTVSAESVLSALDVLAGEYTANGVLTYDINLKQK